MFWLMNRLRATAGPTRSVVSVRTSIPVRLGRIEMTGRIEAGRGIHPRAPRRYPSHAIMLVTGGTGRYRGVDDTAPLSAGSLVLVRPGEPHWYGPAAGASWDEVFCAFSGPVFDLAVRRGALGGANRVAAVADPARLAAYLERLRLAPPPTTSTAQDAEALDLLVLVEQALTPTAPERPAVGWLARSMQLLAADDGGGLTEIAAAVGVPYETWRRRFRDQVGVAPARYRREARLRSSATLLTMTSLSVTEIAHRTGFVDDRHLSRHFIRAYGLTPGRFRSQGGWR